MRCVLSVLAAMAVLCQAARPETATIKAESVEASPRGKAAVAIEISGAKGFCATYLEVAYDASILSVDQVEAGPLLKSAVFEADTRTPGVVLLKMGKGEALGGDGILATIHFKVVGNWGSASDLMVKNCRVCAPGEGSELVAVETVPGRVMVRGGFTWGIGIIGGAFLLLFLALLHRHSDLHGRPVANASCAKCGTRLDGDMRFCEHCEGARR